MKRIYTLIMAVLLTATVWAQSPNKMSYQAVVRDANNELVSNADIGMQISILQGSADGSSVYTETQIPQSNGNGLVSLEIGMGNTVDDFSTIDWSAGPYFIKTETDPTGGSNYTITGTSQLMSVPYALYAATSGSSTPGPQGEVGPQGPAGLDGADGADGSDGSAGSMGPIGLPGLAGATGAQGPAGATGPAGTDGATGPQGPTGPAGTAGNDGATGATGSQGPAGADGVGIAQTLSQSGNDITLSDGGGTVTITDNDTQLDAAGVTALGFVSGAHTIYTAGSGIDITSNVISAENPTYTVGLNLTLGGYIIEVSPNGKHGLVVALQDQSSSVTWYESNDVCSNAANHTTDGANFKNWRLPTKRELNLMYTQKSAIDIAALANGGVAFTAIQYWSSTESLPTLAWFQHFINGNGGTTDKSGSTLYVRSVRAF